MESSQLVSETLKTIIILQSNYSRYKKKYVSQLFQTKIFFTPHSTSNARTENVNQKTKNKMRVIETE